MILMKKNFFNMLVAGSVLIFSLPVATLQSDSKQPIQINSAKQLLDLEKNITTFINNVTIKQGSINVQADKVVVTQQNSCIKNILVEAYGAPAIFYQLQDNGKPIKGCSNKIRYEMEKDLIILTGNAYLEQIDSNIKGDKIIYLVKNQEMEAFSDKGKWVTTTILLSSKL